jgi:hypothetical protein
MNMKTTVVDLPGGQELVDWFGCIPHFHDAYLLDVNLSSKGESIIRIHAFRMTNEVDAKGYYVLDRHVVVTITLATVTHVALAEFDLPGIISDLSFSIVEDSTELAWTGSYGIEGTIRAKQVRFDFVPGKPA